MRTLLVKFIFLFFICFISTLHAEVENSYHFTSPLEEKRFHQLISELRCLVCQNQSLAESNAPLARDLKREVYLQINQGLTDAQIKHSLVERYGEYILFNPHVSSTTFLLWLGPFIFLCGAFLIMYVSIKRQSSHNLVSDEERLALNEMSNYRN